MAIVEYGSEKSGRRVLDSRFSRMRFRLIANRFLLRVEAVVPRRLMCIDNTK